MLIKLLIGACLLHSGVSAWGAIGHQTIASVAQLLLESNAANHVNNLLNGSSMADVSTWADDIRHTSEWHWTGPLHYINTPDQLCSYAYERDCKEGNTLGFCVAGAIANYSRQLVGFRQKGLKAQDDSIVDALKFVIHFVGDIHQPLHVGFTSDEGGNLVMVEYDNKKERLHGIWDTNIIEDILANEYNGTAEQWAAALWKQVTVGNYSTETSKWTQCNDATSLGCVNPLAEESIGLACQYSYECKAQGSQACVQEGVIVNATLGSDYYRAAVPIINLRIAQAAVRLAAYLNNMLEA